MIYYKSGEKLIQYNPETNVYKLRNCIEQIDTRIDIEDFNLLDSKKIKKEEFSRLMNLYYKNIKHSWIYENTKFKKIENFEYSEYNLSKNYIVGKDIPYHKIEGMEWIGNVIMVYHWGRIYYHTISYNGYKQGQLIDPKTKNLVRWAQLKHCSPILNTETNKII